MAKSNSVRMAFWKYDLFPYILCGEIDEKNSNGDSLYIPSFQGSIKNPLFVLAIKDGKKLESELLKLKQGRRKEETAIHEKYIGLLNSTLSSFGLKSIK